ncbi:MAG: DUF927 domain-containing protein [Deltaproteobacteria bacterium]|jgi:hypothetical protein|nr:DUF927 domain-containing protein [Deltaproteobacteria bacterium]
MPEPGPADILRTLLPSEGRYFSASYGDFHAQDQVGTLEEVVRLAMRNRDRGGEAYMALGGFDGTGRRQQVNVVALRCLWLDVDCDKPGKPPQPFPDQPAALEALDAFVLASGLPRPTVISSGWGLHVYWPFDRDVAPARWQPLAEALKAAAARLGFPTDRHRTADSASVLRVPGTLNHREGQVRDVFLMETGEPSDPAALEAILAAVPAAAVSPAAGGAPAALVPPGLAAAVEGLVNNRERDPAAILRGCPQMAAAGLPGAERDSWALMLAVARFCRDGLRLAHAVSRRDPGRYDPAALEYQFNSLGKGPPTCARFAEADPAPCEGCPSRGRISSPVQLGDPRPAAAAVPPHLPAGTLVPFEGRDFRVVPGQGVRRLERDKKTGLPAKDKDGNDVWVLINHNEFYIDEIQLDDAEVQERRLVKFLVRSPGGPLRAVFFDLGLLDPAQTSKWLAHHGLLPLTGGLNHAMWTFMSTYIAHLQASGTTRRVGHFGWTGYGDGAGRRREGFVLGHRLLTADGPQAVALTDARCAAMAREEYVAAGDLETWKQIPRMYRVLGQPEGQLFMCAAFAAPFMAKNAGTANNLVLSIWDSRGGRGKSTLLEAVNTVWGHPKALSCSRNDSFSARYQILGVRRNLPLCMDELTTMADKALSSFIFDASSGREGRKSRRSGTALAATGHWETITMVTSNRSLHEVLRGMSGQTVAETMRVVEMPCLFGNLAGTRAGTYVADVSTLMGQHHGLAGPWFLEACFRWPGVFESVPAEAAAFAQDVMADSAERFWAYGLGTVLAAGRLAAHWGLLDYDLDALEDWTRGSLVPSMRSQVRRSVVAGPEVLATFLNDHLDNLLVVGSAERPEALRKIPLSATAIDPYVLSAPRSRLYARIERDTRRVFAAKACLDKWLGDLRLSPATFLDELARAGAYDPAGGLRERFRLGRGTLHDHGRTACYAFDGLALGDGLPDVA